MNLKSDMLHIEPFGYGIWVAKKKTQCLSNISFLDRFSASTVVNMEMAKNEIFSYVCLVLKWKLLVMLRSAYK